jgi:hypothetical protein
MERVSIISLVCFALCSANSFGEVQQSVSFRVYSYCGGPTEEEFLRRCHSVKSEVERKWLGKSSSEPLEPCCDIVLHASRTAYIQAIGQGGIRSYGSTLIRADGEKVAMRRIDLLTNQDGQFTALTHELTHVILADRFGSDRPPLWADEGIATLADSTAKRSLHHKDCMTALHSGTSLRIVDLLQMDQFASPRQVPAFYGQSLTLVQFLVERNEPSKFIPFLELAKEHGYDRALREVYDIDGVVDLEALWRDFAISGNSVNRTSPHIAAGG